MRCEKYLTIQKIKIFALIFSALHTPNVSDKLLAETADRTKVSVHGRSRFP